jgi:NitT/TauT family transport system substrate-binding protein
MSGCARHGCMTSADGQKEICRPKNVRVFWERGPGPAQNAGLHKKVVPGKSLPSVGGHESPFHPNCVQRNDQVKTRITILLLSVIILVVLTGCDSSKPKMPPVQSVENLTLGTAHPEDLGALIWIAEDKGYFSANGLKVNIKTYDAGVRAAKDLLAGKLDLATATDFVVARSILNGDDLRIICNICEVGGETIRIAARKDHGITKLSDIRGKRFGVALGSIGEFALDLLLVIQNIPIRKIEKVDLSPSEQISAISEGKVDALITWEPFYSKISRELGTNFVGWPIQSIQNYYWFLLGTSEGIRKRPQAIRNFVASLVSAENFMKKHIDESERIVARKLGPNHIESLWSELRFNIGLDDSMGLIIKGEMRWMNPDLHAKDSAVPDILPYIYFDALNSVQPERIKMVH